MKYEPYDYQKYATNFIEEKQASAVFLSMGLGKTVITLSALFDLLFDSFDVHKVLVIAPLRVAKFTWPSEIEKWEHLNFLKYSVVVGTEAQRKKALDEKADIYIINRENVQWLIDKSGYKFDYDMIVIDELSSFKNGKSVRFKSLLKVRPLAKRIVGLTGTPSGNGLMDLWAEFKLLDYGVRLERFITHYRNKYFIPDKRNGEIVYSYKLIPGADKVIYHKISDITMSMKAEDYLKMPKLIYRNHEVEMPDNAIEVYRNLQDDFIQELKDKDEEITVANAAVLTNKLLQVSNGALYTDNGSTFKIHDAKLDALEDLIEASNGKPMLVAYWFKHDLERIKERLDSLGVNYGCLDKDDAIRKWNEGKLNVGLIHPASAGHGLNLQSGGNVIVWFGLTWSLELYEQTNARLYRQGQKAESVIVIHLISKGTIDEDVLDVIHGKATRQNALLKAVKAEV